MPFRDWKLRIADILQAVQDIEQFTQGMTLKNSVRIKWLCNPCYTTL